MSRKEYISVDLEAHPLQINTKSDWGYTRILFYEDFYYNIRVDINYFEDPLTLRLDFFDCPNNDTEVLLGSASKERIKIWTIVTRRNNITVNLNGMRVLDAEYISQNCFSEYEITHVVFHEKSRNSSEYRILEAGMY